MGINPQSYAAGYDPAKCFLIYNSKFLLYNKIPFCKEDRNANGVRISLDFVLVGNVVGAN
jgi:hypothetical protein